MLANKKTENYLDFIPRHREACRWENDEEKNVTLLIENKGVFHFLAQKLLKKPKISYIHLEKIGSFVWPLMDGKRSVYELGQMLKEAYGEEAEPLYPRLVQYIGMLEQYGFISLVKASELK